MQAVRSRARRTLTMPAAWATSGAPRSARHPTPPFGAPGAERRSAGRHRCSEWVHLEGSIGRAAGRGLVQSGNAAIPSAQTRRHRPLTPLSLERDFNRTSGFEPLTPSSPVNGSVRARWASGICIRWPERWEQEGFGLWQVDPRDRLRVLAGWGIDEPYRSIRREPAAFGAAAGARRSRRRVLRFGVPACLTVAGAGPCGGHERCTLTTAAWRASGSGRYADRALGGVSHGTIRPCSIANRRPALEDVRPTRPPNDGGPHR